MSYPVRAALRSSLFDLVVVSTDDAEIARAAEEAGASIMRRPPELAEDNVQVIDVCLHTLDELAARGRKFEELCSIYPTAIFITAEDLRQSYRLLDAEPPADFVMGVSEFDKHPVLALREENGLLHRMWPEYQGVRSQFYPRLLASNGTFYWAQVAKLRETRSFYTGRLKGYVIPRDQAIDINTPDDLRVAQALAAMAFG